MGLPAIGTTNFGIGQQGGDIQTSTGCNQTTNLSLSSLITGGSFNGIQHSFSVAGGSVSTMTQGSPPPTLSDAPHGMGECRGLSHDSGGGFGQLCINDSISVNTSLNTYKNIYDLKVGDIVLSYNQVLKKNELVPILQIETPKHDNMYIVNMENEEQFSMTDDHPIYKSNGVLASVNPKLTKKHYDIDAEELKVGDTLFTLGKKLIIKEIIRFEGVFGTYTLLTKHKNFYAEDVLVHSEL